MNFIAENHYWISLFIALACLTEFFLSFGKNEFNLRITLSNMVFESIGILKLVFAIPGILAYLWVFNNVKAFHLSWSPQVWWHWIGALILADLAYYIFHYTAHKFNIVWGAHIVHHQPTEFNMSLSARDSLLEGFFRHIPKIPFALIGIPPTMFYPMVFLIHIYMLWIHTEVIGKLGILEEIFVTPSQHRVHHIRNGGPSTKTKNLGGVFVIWDKIFGTFQEEKERNHVYGLSESSPIYDPWKAQTFYYRHLLASLFKVSFKDKFRLLFSGYLPEPVRAVPDEQKKFKIRALDLLLMSWILYLSWHFISTFGQLIRLYVYRDLKLPGLKELSLLLISVVLCFILLVAITRLLMGVLNKFSVKHLVIMTALTCIFLQQYIANEYKLKYWAPYYLVDSKIVFFIIFPLILMIIKLLIKRKLQ